MPPAPIPTAFEQPTVPYTDGGYSFVETSDAWKTMCLGLPCFTAVHWPDYDTKVISTTIGGQDVVIQLWKGWCQQFLGMANFPGGIGAEVGVYRRIPGKQMPQDLSFLPEPLRTMMVLAGKLDPNNLWWPYPELQSTASFTLVNPKTNQPFFTTGSEQTYWRNRWMSLASYNQYKATTTTPDFSADYRLDYTINGVDYSW